MNLLKENYKELIIENLPTEKGKYAQFEGLSMTKIEEVFGIFIEETNGCDMDWSDYCIVNDKEYHVWGSVRDSGFCVQLK